MTDKDTYGVSRRKLLAGLGTIGGASAIGGAATSALLWDEEKFGTGNNPNLLRAGKLDLKVDWEEHYNGKLQGTSNDHDGPDDHEVANEPDLVDQPPPVIRLMDVKPGDSGEVTFSLHLFGNPGWVSMCGELHADEDNRITEPEDMVTGEANDSDGTEGGDLADHIRARAWYDVDGDNELDVGREGENGPEPIFAKGSLAEVLDALETCQVLDPTVYDDHKSSGAIGGAGEGNGEKCIELEKLEWDEENSKLDSEDEGSGDDDEDGKTVDVVMPDEGGEGYVTHTQDTGTYRFKLDETFVTQIEITVTERDEEEGNQPTEFKYEVKDGSGICEVIVKGGPGEASYDNSGCITEDDSLSAPINDQTGRPYGVSHIKFFACGDGEEENGDTPSVNGDCFTNSTTYHVGFEWWLPRDIPGVIDNIVQTDRAEFQLSFEAVQCRHNVNGNGEPITLLPDADAENNAQHHAEDD